MKSFLGSAAVASLLFASVFGGIAMRSANAEVVELLTNGGFSNSDPTMNQAQAWFTVTSLPGWTTTNPSGEFKLSGQNAFIYPAQISGTGRGAALNLQNQSGGQPFTYSQTVTLTSAVTSATFSFYSSEYWGGNTIWQLSSNLQGVLLSGTQVNTYDVWTLVSNTLSSGQAASLQSGEQLTVSFRTPAGTGPGAGIDNVSLVVTTVPEPEMLAGIGVIGSGLAAFVRRRLRTAKSAS